MIPSEILKNVKNIHIRTRRVVSEIFSGQYHSVFKGCGIEFDEVRAYQPGDDVRLIDWNVTARTGFPHIKKFVEEREQTLMLILDASGSGEFGSIQRNKREYVAELGAVLAFSAIKNQDKVGLIIFTDQVERYIPPKKGKKHVLRVIREILYFQPEQNGTNIQAALRFLMSIIKRHAVCFLISDFFASGYEKDLEIARRRHDMIAVSVTDPRECEIHPVGIIKLRDIESENIVFVDTVDPDVRRHYRENSLSQIEKRNALFKMHKIDHIEIRTDHGYIRPLKKFFAMRERRK